MASPSKNPDPKIPQEQSQSVRSSAATPMDTSPPSISPLMAMSVDETSALPSPPAPALTEVAPLPPKPPTKKPKRKAPASSPQPKAPVPKRSSSRLKSKISKSSSQGTTETVELSDESPDLSSSAHASDENFVPEKNPEPSEDSLEKWLGDEEAPLALTVKKSKKGKGKMSATSHVSSKKVTSSISPKAKSPVSRGTSLSISETSDEVVIKSPTESIFPPPHFSLEFHTKENMLSMLNHSSKRLLKERFIDEDDLKSHGVFQFLEDRNFIHANLFPSTFVEGVVRNFYANLHADLDNSNSAHYEKVFVRGKTYSFSPSLINKTLGLKNVSEDGVLVNRDKIANLLTNGVLSVWPRKKNDKSKFDHLLASRLTSLFSVLHKLCITNWLPTTNEQYVTLEQARLLYKLGKNENVNLGWQIFKHLSTWGRKSEFSVFPYPSLIFQVLKGQGLSLVDSDSYTQELDYYKVDTLLTKKGQGGVRYTADLPWDKSKDVGSSSAHPATSSAVPHVIPSRPIIPPTLLSSLTSSETANVPTIPTEVVLEFLYKLIGEIGEFITHIISSQPGGVDAVHTAGVVPPSAAGTDAAADVGENAEQDTDEEQEEEEEGGDEE